jgi:hypothetical protein
MVAAVLPLAVQLLPLLPGAIKGILDIVNMIARHPDTPQAAQQQLTDIGAALDAVAQQVATVRV